MILCRIKTLYPKSNQHMVFVSHGHIKTHTLTDTVIQKFDLIKIYKNNVKSLWIWNYFGTETIRFLLLPVFFLLTVCVAPIFLFNICISRFNTFSKSTVKAAKGLRKAMLYISSTKNSEILLWHSHFYLYGSKSCSSWYCQMAKPLQTDAPSAKTKLLYL